MTNREAQKRLRAVGWVYWRDAQGCRYGFVRAYPRGGWAECHAIQDVSRSVPLRDANRRLVEFVEKHFGEGK